MSKQLQNLRRTTTGVIDYWQTEMTVAIDDSIDDSVQERALEIGTGIECSLGLCAAHCSLIGEFSSPAKALLQQKAFC